MGIFSKKIGTVFLKETSDVQEFISKMQKLQEHASGDVKKEIEMQIKLASYGEAGEKNIAFELKNSDIDMYVLHDIYIEAGDLSAQIDYLIFTKKCTYVIECKNLIGNIEVDSEGNFVRTYELFGKKVKEGIYSPITQNQRHLLVMKEIRKESCTNILQRKIIERYFGDYHKSIVVLANSKTCLNVKYAKKDIKEQVIRADQLITYIKKKDSLIEISNSDKYMRDNAQFYINANQSKKSDYTKKYEEIIANIETTNMVEIVEKDEPINKTESTNRNEVRNPTEFLSKADSIEPVSIYTNKKSEIAPFRDEELPSKKLPTEAGANNNKNRNEEIVIKLKAYRLEQSRVEKIKPYYIFNDAQMNELIEQNPESKEELLKIKGFGNVKVEKYGSIILELLKNFNK